MSFKFCALVLSTLQLVSAQQSPIKGKSPYVELLLCPTYSQPWNCAKNQTLRLLHSWSRDLRRQWEDLKVEADTELNSTLLKRGFSANEKMKEKPSTILDKIARGVNYIQDFVETTTDQLLGRQEEYDLPESDEDEKGQNILSEQISHRHRKKKKHQQNAVTSLIQHDNLNLGGLEDIAAGLQALGHKKKIKIPHKYGRSVGVTRHKRKKKKILMKVILLATLIKGKIELLLKLLSAHLQIKFFAIALIGLLMNLAKFWMELKKGHTPQKVIYYEHAHHQHHYEDHGDDWGGDQSGGYWKRSVQSVQPPLGSYEDGKEYFNENEIHRSEPQLMAYRGHLEPSPRE